MIAHYRRGGRRDTEAETRGFRGGLGESEVQRSRVRPASAKCDRRCATPRTHRVRLCECYIFCRNWTAISNRPLLTGRLRTTSQRWVVECEPGPSSSIAHSWPTARLSLSRNDTPLNERSRVR